LQYDLSKHTVIITGATTGLGKLTAAKFLEYGANVCIFGRNCKDFVEKNPEIFNTELNQKLYLYEGNCAVESDFQDCVANTIDKFGAITGLINNAAIHGPIGSTETVDSSEWFKAIQNNLMSTFIGCKSVLPHMQANNYGKIVNLSGSGEKPLPRFSAYSTSKAAVVKLTEVLAAENESYNIFVNSIAPGPMNTFFLEDVLSRDPSIVGEAIYKKRMEQKQNGGVDMNIPADLCAYLISEKSEFFTGKLISAIWDDWKNFDIDLKDEFANSDIYTMRRQIDSKERF
jgi:3-oxoacyl-[acyl-carrier protein] reductase